MEQMRQKTVYHVKTLSSGKGVMKTRELLTVKEAAEIANVTTQAIYQRLKKDLKPYVVYENGKTLLSAEVVKVLKKDEAGERTSANTEGSHALLQSAIESLMEQLSTKDAQIAVYQDEVIKQNEHARDQSDRLIALVEQVNDLQKNNQILLKTEQDKKILAAHMDGRGGKPRRSWIERLFGKPQNA